METFSPCIEFEYPDLRLKKIDTNYNGVGLILKWMPVTFLATPATETPSSARSRSTRVAETSRELLMKIKELAEDMGFRSSTA